MKLLKQKKHDRKHQTKYGDVWIDAKDEANFSAIGFLRWRQPAYLAVGFVVSTFCHFAQVAEIGKSVEIGTDGSGESLLHKVVGCPYAACMEYLSTCPIHLSHSCR